MDRIQEQMTRVKNGGLYYSEENGDINRSEVCLGLRVLIHVCL